MRITNEASPRSEALRRQGQARFDDALRGAGKAIDARDAAAAKTAFDVAASVYPDDKHIAEGRTRVQQLPQIIELFADANRAVERNDWRTALAKYREIERLDPKTAGLTERLQDAQTRVANLDYQGTLSTGYAALESGDYDAAKRAFQSALRQRPNDGAAQDGMSQVEQRATLTDIERYRQSAQRAESDERWSDAVAAYEKVLAVDPAIKFAMDGRARANGRALLDRKLEAALADTGALSSDATFTETVALYQGATKIADPGPRLSSQLDRLEKALALAADPVPVTLTSDAATEVTISQLGALGKFSRKDLKLRPGRYILKGSRDGRRDVRVEVDVVPQMAAIEINAVAPARCNCRSCHDRDAADPFHLAERAGRRAARDDRRRDPRRRRGGLRAQGHGQTVIEPRVHLDARPGLPRPLQRAARLRRAARSRPA